MYFEAISIGYKTIQTKTIKLEFKNVNINFFMFEDDRPFINCEEIN